MFFMPCTDLRHREERQKARLDGRKLLMPVQ